MFTQVIGLITEQYIGLRSFVIRINLSKLRLSFIKPYRNIYTQYLQQSNCILNYELSYTIGYRYR